MTVVIKGLQKWEVIGLKATYRENVTVLPTQHGRLIDGDALTKMCREMQSIDWNKKAFPYSWEHAYEEFENDIDEAPTVIEAEVSEG